MSLEALALYIYTNVVRKISIGSPENSTKVFSCGFSSVFRKERACIHGGNCADTNKCIYVHTKSLDPVWSPMCVRCMGKANPIDFSTVLRKPPQSKRGRVHCKIMTIIEKALAASLTIVFNPSRGVHALNTLHGTPEEYLIGTVDQEMSGHRGDTNEMRFRMPVNTAVQHRRPDNENGKIFGELEEKFSLMEDPFEPVKFMFEKPKECKDNPAAQAMLESFLENGGGYVTKKNFIIRVDSWNYATRIMRALRKIRGDNIFPTFNMEFGTQGMHNQKSRAFVLKDHGTWIIYDSVGGFDLYGERITVTTTLDHFCLAFTRCKKAKILVIHADQLSHRRMANLMEAIQNNTEKITEVTFTGLYSLPRKKDGDKGAPMLDYFCRKIDVFKNFNSWGAFENRSKTSTDCFYILPYPEHKLEDIGTYAASTGWNQPFPQIAMQATTGKSDLKHHCLNLNQFYLHPANKTLDVLDLVPKA